MNEYIKEQLEHINEEELEFNVMFCAKSGILNSQVSILIRSKNVRDRSMFMTAAAYHTFTDHPHLEQASPRSHPQKQT